MAHCIVEERTSRDHNWEAVRGVMRDKVVLTFRGTNGEDAILFADSFGAEHVYSFESEAALESFGIGPLIDSKCEMTGAQQTRDRTYAPINGIIPARNSPKPFVIELGITPHFAIRGDINHECPYRTVALRLDRKHAIEFQRARDQSGERQQFAQQ